MMKNVILISRTRAQLSCRKIKKGGVARSDAKCVEKKYKCHHYKFKLMQHLHSGDGENQVKFCH